MASREPARLLQLRCSRVRLELPGGHRAGERRRQQVRPRRPRIGLGRRGIRLSVDDPVERPAQRDVASEERAPGVERQHGQALGRLGPEARLVDTEVLRDLLHVRGRQRSFVELAREHLLVGRLLVQVPAHVDAAQVRGTDAAVVRVAAELRDGVRLVAAEEVRARGRIAARDLAAQRQAGCRRLEERHLELRQEGRVGAREVDDQPVALDHDASNVPCAARVHSARADDVRAVRIRDEGRTGRGEVMIRDPVERVAEARGGHGQAVAEAEALADREGPGTPVARDAVPRRDLRHEARAGRAGPIGVVDELRRGRVLEPPRCRDVRELRVDLHRGPGDAVAEDPALPEAERRAGQLRCDQHRHAEYQRAERDPEPCPHAN